MKLEWFGQPGHFIGARNCHFHLHTHVNGYCVSTVGEWRPSGPDAPTEEIGHQRLYETMVFKLNAAGTDIEDHTELWLEPYNDRDTANAGHMTVVKKWGGL